MTELKEQYWESYIIYCYKHDLVPNILGLIDYAAEQQILNRVIRKEDVYV